jgi:hypothetical protein
MTHSTRLEQTTTSVPAMFILTNIASKLAHAKMQSSQDSALLHVGVMDFENSAALAKRIL